MASARSVDDGLERVEVDELRPGDVLLVRRVPDEPLGEMITALDGSDYSHAGIAVGRGMIASSHQALKAGRRPDLGGVRIEELSAFWAGGRDVHRLPVADVHRRNEALGFVLRTLRRGDGRFSYPKLFLIAGALSALDPDTSSVDPDARTRLLEAALAAGHAWSSTEREASYYCAEFVAAAFGATFPVRALAPPPDGRVHFDGLDPLPRAARTALRVLLRPGGGDEDVVALRRTTMKAFVAELEHLSPAFVRGTVHTLTDQLRRLSDSVLRASAAGPDVPARRDLVDDEPPEPGEPMLPPALVTPRMLRRASWTGDPQVIRRP